MAFSQWPAPARAIAAAVQEAVAAVGARPAFEEAVAQLAALDQAQVTVVLGSVLQMLMEETAPDGLAADDVQSLLEKCVRNAAAWYPAVQVEALVIVVAGALGMQDPDADPRIAPPVIATHAALLVHELLAVTRRPLGGYLEIALGEIARAETIEMP
ncbi:MAG TPA: hypothetical protein VHC49_14610 [Mycobacteriales bacterium]|nr:hypothetical protein [Mycobacteriales bacterium]